MASEIELLKAAITRLNYQIEELKNENTTLKNRFDTTCGDNIRDMIIYNCGKNNIRCISLSGSIIYNDLLNKLLDYLKSKNLHYNAFPHLKFIIQLVLIQLVLSENYDKNDTSVLTISFTNNTELILIDSTTNTITIDKKIIDRIYTIIENADDEYKSDLNTSMAYGRNINGEHLKLYISNLNLFKNNYNHYCFLDYFRNMVYRSQQTLIQPVFRDIEMDDTVYNNTINFNNILSFIFGNRLQYKFSGYVINNINNSYDYNGSLHNI